MGKVEDNKKLKMNTLLQTAFDLFTGKGFAKTTVSDIVNQAGLAKGTFYLYFKDKYDLRDKLIAFKASQLFIFRHISSCKLWLKLLRLLVIMYVIYTAKYSPCLNCCIYILLSPENICISAATCNRKLFFCAECLALAKL